MRALSAAFVLLTFAGAVRGQDMVDLHLVEIDGDTVTVEYSKNFDTCAHLYNSETNQITHIQNLFCETGDNVVAVNDISKFTELEVGDVVRLQHGNNGAIRSEDVTVTAPDDGCPLVSLLDQVERGAVRQLDRVLQSQWNPARTLQIVRRFRDEVLAASPEGRSLIALYYRHGAEVREILTTHPHLGLRAVALVMRAQPALDEGAAGVTLDRALFVDGLAFLEEIAAYAGPELQTALGEVRSELAAHGKLQGESIALDFGRAEAPESSHVVQRAARAQSRRTQLAAVAFCAVGLALMGMRRR